MNAVLETIKKRRSVRKYKPDQILDAELSQIIEAGRHAASGGNNQLSHLIVLQNKDVLEKLIQLIEAEFAKMEMEEGMYKSLQNSIRASKKGGYRSTFDAPTVVAVANQRGYGNAMADASLVLGNMMIAACSLGVGSCWLNQLHWLDENPAIRACMLELGLRENETICGALALGYSAMGEPAPLQRNGNLVTYVK